MVSDFSHSNLQVDTGCLLAKKKKKMDKPVRAIQTEYQSHRPLGEVHFLSS